MSSVLRSASDQDNLHASILSIDAQFKTALSSGIPKPKAVCEALQRCFDLLGLTVTTVEDLRDKTERFVLQDELLRIAIDRGWLPEAMEPGRIPWGHREWLNSVIAGRIAYPQSPPNFPNKST